MNDEQTTIEKSRLGKEAKIGVTVILVLLLVFAAALVVRLCGLGSGEEVAAADQKAGTANLPEENKGNKTFQAAKPKSPDGNPPTILLAKADADRPPKAIDSDLDKWKLVSDKGKENPIEGGGPALISPPPLPPKPLPGNRYDDNSGALSQPEPSRPDRSYADTADQFAQAAPVSRYGPPEYPRRSSGQLDDDAPRSRSRSRSFGSPPPLCEDGKYEVQPLDSYWTISEKLYGTGAYFKALAEHNRGKGAEEGELKPGDLVSAPPVEQLEKSYPDLCPKPSRRETLRNRASTVGTHRQYRSGRTYTVAEGDTLFDIARYELGKASRWVEIYELNRDVLGKDFNYITPGTQLILPDGGRPDVLAEPPNSGYRR